jgi:hypothetical protein
MDRPESDQDSDSDPHSSTKPPKKKLKAVAQKRKAPKAKTKAPKKAKTTEVLEVESDTEQSDSAVAIKRGRGRPKGSVKKVDDAFRVSIFVEIVRELKLVKGKTRRGDKTVAQEPYRVGPFPLTQSSTWNSCVSQIAEVSETQKENLATGTMEWRWNKSPAGKGCLPLTSRQGFETMVEQILASKLAAGGVIIISMAQPLQNPRSQGLASIRTLSFLSGILNLS